MGAAAYNRGSRIGARAADACMAVALARSERCSQKDELTALRERITKLERDLSRARRCLAAERHGREQLRQRLAAEERSYEFATSVLCPLAFPRAVSK